MNAEEAKYPNGVQSSFAFKVMAVNMFTSELLIILNMGFFHILFSNR